MKKLSVWRFERLFDGQTTDQRTDMTSCRRARTHIKAAVKCLYKTSIEMHGQSENEKKSGLVKTYKKAEIAFLRGNVTRERESERECKVPQRLDGVVNI